MTNSQRLLVQLTALKARGIGGERLEADLQASLPVDESAIDTLRTLYMESDESRAIARWALTELESEIRELEEILLAA